MQLGQKGMIQNKGIGLDDLDKNYRKASPSQSLASP